MVMGTREREKGILIVNVKRQQVQEMYELNVVTVRGRERLTALVNAVAAQARTCCARLKCLGSLRCRGMEYCEYCGWWSANSMLERDRSCINMQRMQVV